MRNILLSFMLVGVGGAFGAMTRLGLSLLFAHQVIILPLGTFAANLLGCFVMGILVQLMATTEWFNQGSLLSEQNRLLFAVGFCGSLTTLSSVVVEISNLVQRNEMLGAFSYLFATFVGGFACFFAGTLLVRA